MNLLQKFDVVDVFRAAPGAFAYLKGFVRPVPVRNYQLFADPPDYPDYKTVKSVITVLACEIEIC